MCSLLCWPVQERHGAAKVSLGEALGWSGWRSSQGIMVPQPGEQTQGTNSHLYPTMETLLAGGHETMGINGKPGRVRVGIKKIPLQGQLGPGQAAQAPFGDVSCPTWTYPWASWSSLGLVDPVLSRRPHSWGLIQPDLYWGLLIYGFVCVKSAHLFSSISKLLFSSHLFHFPFTVLNQKTLYLHCWIFMQTSLEAGSCVVKRLREGIRGQMEQQGFHQYRIKEGPYCSRAFGGNTYGKWTQAVCLG